MLVIKLKGPATLGNLQGPFEASIQNRRTWDIYSDHVERFVQFAGSTSMPDDITRGQVAEFLSKASEKYKPSTVKSIRSACSCFYTWMQHMEFAATNPFRSYKLNAMEYNPVQIIPYRS